MNRANADPDPDLSHGNGVTAGIKTVKQPSKARRMGQGWSITRFGFVDLWIRDLTEYSENKSRALI